MHAPPTEQLLPFTGFSNPFDHIHVLSLAPLFSYAQSSDRVIELFSFRPCILVDMTFTVIDTSNISNTFINICRS